MSIRDEIREIDEQINVIRNRAANSIRELERRRFAIQSSCPHASVEMTRDPSGNSDHDYQCRECGGSGVAVKKAFTARFTI